MILFCRAQCHGECRGECTSMEWDAMGGGRGNVMYNTGNLSFQIMSARAIVFSRQIKFVAWGKMSFFWNSLEGGIFVLERYGDGNRMTAGGELR